jgi:hypothetical protein
VQTVPALADQGLYIGSESSYYRVLHQEVQCQWRGWSWDITYLPNKPQEAPEATLAQPLTKAA